jgi:hypothetical protein
MTMARSRFSGESVLEARGKISHGMEMLAKKLMRVSLARLF